MMRPEFVIEYVVYPTATAIACELHGHFQPDLYHRHTQFDFRDNDLSN